MYLTDKINDIPKLPGIYRMYDSQGRIIYVGKSKCLKNRVKSYFNKNKQGKVKKLVSQIFDIDYIVTDTHLEARLLECKLIKEIKPIFNSQMKNDQGYVYLKVEEYNRFNALSTVSVRVENTYGPFRKKFTLSRVIESVRCILPIIKYKEMYSFEYNIIPENMNRETFEQNRENLTEIFTCPKKMDNFLNELKIKMEDTAAKNKFEIAAKYRDLINDFKYINNGIWRYYDMLLQDIVLKIPIPYGFKMFFISKGRIVLSKKVSDLNSNTIDDFIKICISRTFDNHINKDIDEKESIDYKDIILSEIISLPDEWVVYKNTRPE